MAEGGGKRRRREEHHEEEAENNERWLLTYSDMITLLLGLFIMLYSMSNVDAQKFQQFARAANSVLGNNSGDSVIAKSDGSSVIENNFPMQNQNTDKSGIEKSVQGGGIGNEQKALDDLAKKLKEYIDKNGLNDKIKVENQLRGVALIAMKNSFFDSGSAEITKRTRAMIDSIGKILNTVPGNSILVEGHTDNIPISSSQYKTNWELSSARANNVLHVLMNDLKINPLRLTSSGYGEYRPEASNSTEIGRAQNRRVEIVVLKDEYSKGLRAVSTKQN